MLPIRWLERDWVCLPERALWWPEQRALICADLHAGKDEAFRRAGLPLPEGALADDLHRLDAAIEKTAPRTLVILGDFFHARTGRGPRVTEKLKEWRVRHAGVEIVLLRGNHDRSAGDPPRALEIRVVGSVSFDGLLLRHKPPARLSTSREAFIAGHIHPAVRISALGERLHAPCFWFRSDGIILPAFCSLAGASVIMPRRSDCLVLVGTNQELIEWRVR